MRVIYAYNVGAVNLPVGWITRSFFNVTYRTFRAVTPFPVATHTLTVVSSFQARLAQVYRVKRPAVALPAGRHLACRTIVMTDCATFTHLRHLGMQFMRKYGRLKKVLKFI
jgi:hypothetical protein